MKFSKNLRELINLSGLTVEDFARKVRLTAPSLYSYIKGNHLPNAKTVRLICEVFNVSADWLLDIKRKKNDQ